MPRALALTIAAASRSASVEISRCRNRFSVISEMNDRAELGAPGSESDDKNYASNCRAIERFETW